MPWLKRNRGRRTDQPHACVLPDLYRPISTRRSHAAGFQENAKAGDEWACRGCGLIYEVVERIAAPPGYKGDKSKLTSKYLAWEKTYLKRWQ